MRRVVIFEFFEAGHQGCIHAAKFTAPFVKRGGTHAVLAAQLWNRTAALGLLENGDDLTVGKSG